MKQATILCLASYFKGARLMRAAKAAGANVILVTLEKLENEPWPREAIDEVFLMPDINKQPDITNAVAYLMRDRKIDRIIAMDEYDTVTAARLREYLRIPGLGETTGYHFRDKLAMRVEARDSGIPVPPFVGVLNYDDIRKFMAEVPGPWLLKPRTEASAMGIKRIEHPDQLWPILEELGDKQSGYLMEAFVPGDVYHVDAITSKGKVKFAAASKYGRPPLEVYQGGGVFVTKTVPSGGKEGRALLKANRNLLKQFGMMRGATHAEFIRGEDGVFYFLEVAARVGGASIDLLVEQATGVNLWEEWARVELADIAGTDYDVSPAKSDSAGLLVCLAREARPDTSAYDAPEVVWRMEKKQHAGLILTSPSAERVDTLIDEYTHRFGQDFLAVAPPLESEAEMQARE
ncbi:MAG: ATPase [Rhodothermales bacterium]|nr:ATPase [Rhodothermales bacterium]